MRNCRISVCVAMLLLLCLNISMAAASEMIYAGKDKSSNAQKIRDALVVEQHLYLVEEERIAEYSLNSMQPNTVVDLSGYTWPDVDWESMLLATDGTHLYAISMSVGKVYEVQDHQLKLVVALNYDGLGKEISDNRKQVIFKDPIAIDGMLYVLYLDPNVYQEYELLQFSLETGNYAKIEIGNFSLSELAFYRDGTVLTIDRNTNEMIVINPTNCKVIERLGKLPHQNEGEICYDGQNDQIYYFSGTKLMAWNNGKPSKVDQVRFDGLMDATCAGILHGQYITLSKQGLFACGSQKTNPEPDGITLTLWIYPGSFPDDDLLTNYMIAHQDVTINTEVISEDNLLEMLTNANVSKDSSVDLFLLPSYLIDSHEIFGKGYTAVITSESLQSDVNMMYPQIIDFVSMDGELLAFPAALYPNYWTVRHDLLDEYLQGKVPSTMQEYCELLLQWYQRYGNAGEITFDGAMSASDSRRNTINALLVQYIRTHYSDNEPVKFNTSDFRQLIEALSTLDILSNAESTAYDVTDVYRARLFDTKAISPLLRGINPGHEHEIYILPPVFVEGQTPVISANMDYFIINPNSKSRSYSLPGILPGSYAW